MGNVAWAQESAIQYYSNGTSVMAYTLPFNPPTGEVVIQDTYNGLPVTEISGFNNNTQITSVKLPVNLTVLPASAFSGCIKLQSINLDGVVSIGNSAFQDCVNLGSTLDLTKVTNIGNYAFQGCVALTSLKLGNATIGTSAFSGTSVSTLEFVGLSEIPSGIAPQFASTLTTVILPEEEGLFIASSAFSGCSKLQTINLENVSSIGASAFMNCTGLTSVDLSNVAALGASAFQGCGDALNHKGLSEIVWSAALKSIPKAAFYGCANLETITNIDNVTTINDYAFYGCTSLAHEFSLPKGLTKVGDCAFQGSSVRVYSFYSNPILGTDATPAEMHLILEDVDKAILATGAKNTFDKVVYNRNFGTPYSAVYLPFAAKADDNNKFYTFGSVYGDVISFVEEKAPKANTPYLFAGSNIESAGEVTVSSDFYDVDGGNTKADNWLAVGSYGTSVESDGQYYGISGGNFVRYAAGVNITVKPYRAYWQQINPKGAMLRLPDGSTTSIDFNEMDAQDVAEYFDLMGRRVLEPVKVNISIVNGKKVVY